MITKKDLKGMPLWEAVRKHPDCFRFRDGKEIGVCMEKRRNPSTGYIEDVPTQAKARKTNGKDTNSIVYPFDGMPYYMSYPDTGVFYEFNDEIKESDKDVLLTKALP